MTEFNLERPAAIDWNQTPRLQAQQIFDEVCRHRYANVQGRPQWPNRAAFKPVKAQRQLTAAFEGQAWVWRRNPGPKLLHTRGAVALLRLQPTAAGKALIGPFGEEQWCVARYSRAADTKDFPPVPGIALKLPRMQRPALDLLMVGEVWETGCFKDLWGSTIATAMPDPRESAGSIQKLVLDVLNGFDQVVEALELANDVAAVRLPPPISCVPGIKGKVERLVWKHSTEAVHLLKAWGNTPFSMNNITELEREDTVRNLEGTVWAELVAEVRAPEGSTRSVTFASVFLESRFHVGPVGDYWLHFTHPRGPQ